MAPTQESTSTMVFFVVEQDTNKHILLWGKSTAMTPDDGFTLNFDGYVQKITVIGTVQWMSYLSSMYENDEYVAALLPIGLVLFASLAISTDIK